LQHGADVDRLNSEGRTPLYRAAEHGHDAVVETFLRAGANVELRRRGVELSPLEVAAGNGRVQVMRALVEHGANVNAVGRYKTTPIRSAVIGNRAEATDFLVNAGAALSFHEATGFTLLHSTVCSRKSGGLEAARALIKHA